MTQLSVYIVNVGLKYAVSIILNMYVIEGNFECDQYKYNLPSFTAFVMWCLSDMLATMTASKSLPYCFL